METAVLDSKTLDINFMASMLMDTCYKTPVYIEGSVAVDDNGVLIEVLTTDKSMAIKNYLECRSETSTFIPITMVGCKRYLYFELFNVYLRY